jgi:hypothetical protein
VWKLVKHLNDDGIGRNTKVALKNNVNILMGKQAANCLANSYAEDRNIVVGSEKQRMITEKQQNAGQDGALVAIIAAPITSKELELAV